MPLNLNTIAHAATPSLTNLFLAFGAQHTEVWACGPRAFLTGCIIARHDQQKAVA
ncbi:hypothetical protein [Tateyamaria omphalii]|uniref:hypothetical protein n=1 Tax=Tateyamaria omphalii TaxID=299262 RepID=UPI0012FCD813|nr:hypothetical protein [Tateyamaria omphalii]